MTNTLIFDASAVPAAQANHPSRPVRAPHKPLTFGGVLKSERIKLLSLRSMRVTLLVTVFGGLAMSAMIALLWAAEVPETAAATEIQNYLLLAATFATPFLALIFGMLGVFAIASEYSSGMILSSLAAVPRRGMLFAGKAVVTTLIAAVTALVLVIGGLVIGMAVMPSSAAQLFTPEVLSGVLGTVAYLIGIALLGFGIAGMLRSTAGGIAVIAGITFVLPIAFQVLGITGWEWVPVVSSYLPASLGNNLSMGTAAVDPTFWVALAAMVGWVVAALVPAALTLKLRDAKA